MISTSTKIPFFLQTSAGVGVTGITSANIQGGSAYIVKADGTTASVVLSGANLFEVDSVNQPGIYQFLIPGSVLNVIGKLSIAFYPSIGATFITKVIIEEVGVSISDFALMRKILTNNEVVDQPNGLLRLYDDNGIDVVAEWYLQDDSSTKSIYNIRRKIRK